jgi:uncharacterized phage protein (TIGR02218 family)
LGTIAEGELTSMGLCWRLERTDGAGIGLTSHDRQLDRENITYLPAPGMMPATITRQLGLEPQSGEVTGALSAGALDDADLALGRWNGAQVALTAVDWEDGDAGALSLIGGELGPVSINGEAFSAELRGATAKLDEPVCPATSAECRAHFGDKQCRVDLAGRSVRATVIAVEGAQLTLDQPFDDRFVLGRLRYMSGANCGLTTVILSVNGHAIQIRDLPRTAVEADCSVDLREGCDKRFQTCGARFGNAINFRGEPHLPGTDLLTRYPGI